MTDFYERLTPFFHMICADWDATITAHGEMLDDIYDYSMYFVEDDGRSETLKTHVMRSDYYAISPDHLADLLKEVGFDNVKRVDDGLAHLAIVVGTKPES